MSLWKESFDEAIGEIFFNLPVVLIIWFLTTWFAVQSRSGNEGQITIASFVLMGTVIFLAIFGVVFLIKTYTNLLFVVLKENQGYAKKRITFRELFRKQIVFDEEVHNSYLNSDKP